MKYTSAEVSKLLRKMQDDLAALKAQEAQSCEFLASVGEDPESVRPEYDFDDFNEKMDELSRKIRTVKHQLNLFNVSTVIPEFGITVDEMLVYIPQLTEKKRKLSMMKGKLPKQREMVSPASRSNIIDYRYLNYEVKSVQQEYDKVSDELARAQLALDNVNQTLPFELEV